MTTQENTQPEQIKPTITIGTTEKGDIVVQLDNEQLNTTWEALGLLHGALKLLEKQMNGQ